MKIGLTFGTFDILHPGHIYYLSQAKSQCDYLITIIARDENVKKIKWTYPINNQQTRLNNIKQLNISNQVIIGEKENFLNSITKYQPHIIFLWYDQPYPPNLIDFCKTNNIKIIKLPSYKPKQYKSSKLKTIFIKKLI